MKKPLSYPWFWFRYQMFDLFSKVKKKKPKQYLMCLMGRYPSNLQAVLTNVVAPETDFRYSIGPNCIFALFYSNKVFKHIDDIMLAGLQGQADNFIMATMNKFTLKFFALNMSVGMYRNLFEPVSPTAPQSPFNRLEGMQSIIDTVNRTRSQWNRFIQEISQEIKDYNEEHHPESMMYDVPKEERREPEVEPTAEEKENEINRILDKIQESGYESLTTEERNKLTKYGN